MALSLLTQKPSFSDLQSFFDPFPLQQFQTASSHFAQFNDECNSMEYNSNHNSSNNSNNNYRHYHNQHNFMQQQHYYSNTGSHHKRAEQMHNFDHGSNSSSGSDTQQQQQTQQQHQQSQGNQPIIHSSRPYMNGYHHQHIGSNYEQVISFVDSPPNSEESWTDEPPTQTQQQTKLGATPGPQIIDVQTLYPNSNSSNGAGAGAGGASNSRKRRMDWDSLDIEPNDDDDSTGSGTTTTAAVATKAGGGCPIAAKQSDKDKNKREKSSGRASWTDEIGFDLNAEYNNNSYLNNEPFLSFSQSINALKQEPQTVDLKASKLPLSSLQAKIDKTITAAVTTQQQQQHANEETAPVAIRNNFKSEVKSGAICSSPLSSPKGYESNINGCVDVNGGSGATAEGDNYPSRDNGISVILSVLDAKKTESAATAVTPATTTTSLHTDEHKFQYILAAATSIATKNNEETLTYLNQGQSYEIKLKKIGDLSFYRDKILKSVIKICFHERRLQYMEREQMQQWQASRPGERIIEVDVPLSYGLCHVSQPLNPQHLNTVEVFWDPLKEVGVHIKVNCISTEFTPKKHGGEKGVPFRLQIETYIEKTNSTNNSTTALSSGGAAQATTPAASNSSVGNLTPNSKLACLPLVGSKQPVHAAACQIKVFKLKGADRKHKQDREKIQKRPQSEQEKFQPSYECTIMNEISLDSTVTASQGCYSPDYLKTWPNSPVHMPKYDGILAYANHQSPQSAAGAGAAAAAVTAAATAAGAVCSSPIAINSVTSTNSPNIKMMEAAAMMSPQHVPAEMDDYVFQLMPDSSTTQVAQWLTHHRLSGYIPTFSQFCGADVMRMSKEDLMQICGLADGIRMYNILKSKAITPRLTFYVSLDGLSYNAIYLLTNTAKELIQKLYKLPGFYEILAKCSATANGLDSGAPGTNLFNAWSMHSKYSGSGSNIFNDVNKSAIYLAGPGGVHVTITDEVLNNEIKDNSLYALDMQNGKIIMKLINKCDN